MKIAEKWLGILTLCFFTSFGLLLFLLPDREMSPLENRYLQKRPAFSTERLWSGKWGQEVENWLVDQFPLREEWVGLNSRYEHWALGKTELNGIYLVGNSLYTKTTAPGAAWERNLQALTRIQERLAVPFTVLPVPTATTVYADRLPAHASYYDEQETIERLSAELGEEAVLNLFPQLAAQKEVEKLYFRLDHHWTMDGAYLGYQAFLEKAGLTPFAKDDLQTVTVTDCFYGTAYAKVGLWQLAPETIIVLRPENGYKAQLTVGEETGLPLFAEEKLHEYDKYGYFLGGNQPLHIIDTGLETGRRLVVIKDSYAHIMAPLLSLHYDQVVLMDPRYINADPYELIESFSPSEVLVLMNADNISQENGLSLFLRY